MLKKITAVEPSRQRFGAGPDGAEEPRAWEKGPRQEAPKASKEAFAGKTIQGEFGDADSAGEVVKASVGEHRARPQSLLTRLSKPASTSLAMLDREGVGDWAHLVGHILH